MADNQIFVYVRNQKAALARRFFLVFGDMNEMQMILKGNAVQAIWVQTELLFLLFDAVGGCELSRFYPK